MSGAAAATSVRRVVDGLYVEAMLLADEARAYFEVEARDERRELDQATRVLLSCESLRVTTRLMHVVAWLLTRRAVWAGELTEGQALRPSRRLAAAPDPAEAADPALPVEARRLLAASASLYARAARIDRALATEADVRDAEGGPAAALQRRLAREF